MTILGSTIILGVNENNIPSPITVVDGRVQISDGGGSLTVDGTVTATLPAAVIGPGSPVVDSYFCAKIDLAASTANQEVVAAPGANKQIWVYGLGILLDTAAGTIKFHDSTPTDITGTMALSDEGGLVVAPSGNFSMPIWKCGTNKALQADTGAGTVDGWINGAIVSV